MLILHQKIIICVVQNFKFVSEISEFQAKKIVNSKYCRLCNHNL